MNIANAMPFLGAVQQLRGEVEEVHELADWTMELSAAHGLAQWLAPPVHAIQHRHSHGDVCRWPVKALCDYVEATNDLGFLGQEVGYTDPERFESMGPRTKRCGRTATGCSLSVRRVF